MSGLTAVIQGVGTSDLPRAPQLSALGHMLQASHRALADARLLPGDIDGFMCAGIQGQLFDDVVTAADYAGLRPDHLNGTMTGGSAFEFHLQDAVRLVESGAARHVLIAYGSDLASNRSIKLSFGAERGGRPAGPMMWDSLSGLTIVGGYALALRRHMWKFGTTHAQLDEIARSARLHAARTPEGVLREPLTEDAIAESPMIADPLRAIDCCLVSDGGAAVVVSAIERIDRPTPPPIYILGTGCCQTHWNIGQSDEPDVTGAGRAAQTAMRQAERVLQDIDILQLYDSFTITPLLLFEDMGFCPKGEAGRFVSDGRLRPGGALPMNTDGGGLATCHPGMRGPFLVVEAVRQLRGDAGQRQIPNATTCLVAGSGGILSAIGVGILSKVPR